MTNRNESTEQTIDNAFLATLLLFALAITAILSVEAYNLPTRTSEAANGYTVASNIEVDEQDDGNNTPTILPASPTRVAQR